MTMGRTCGAGAASLGRVAKIASIGSCGRDAPPAEEQDRRHIAQLSLNKASSCVSASRPAPVADGDAALTHLLSALRTIRHAASPPIEAATLLVFKIRIVDRANS